MSIQVITLVWKKFPDGGAKLLTMLALADWASDDGTRIYPGMDTLAAKIRMSERQTHRIVKELCNDGWLENLTPVNAGGKGKSNHYRIPIQTLTNCQGKAPNPDKSNPNPDIAMSSNPDIAMSEDPLDPLYIQADKSARPRKPEPPNLVNERVFLKTLQASPNADPHDIAQCQERIALIIKQHYPQHDPLPGETTA